MAFPPRVSGKALRSLARFARTKVGGALLTQVFRADLQIAEIERIPESLLGTMQLDNRPIAGRPPRKGDAELALPSAPWSGTSESYAAAYRSGKTSPVEVARRAIAAAQMLARTKPSVGPILEFVNEGNMRAECAASEARYRAGNPIGPLDGVPFVVKEEVAVRGLRRQGGTTVEDPSPSAADATLVAKLRAAGAIVLGSTPMTEYGLTPIGYNPKRNMPRNPHATDRVAGGSSTGSGVAVATGLTPFAIGVDGGGSIRIPAALNGVFGIKPSWGRVSRTGSLGSGSVGHIGPLASSTLDLARVLAIICGLDPEDPQSATAPAFDPESMVRSLGRGVRGLTIGIDEDEWKIADRAVAASGREALRALEKEGARLVDVRMKLARHAAAIGYLVISSESAAAHRAAFRENPSAYNADLQISYSVTGQISAGEYCAALRARTGLRREMAETFRTIDLLALPTTVRTAAKVSDSEMESGFLDARVLDDLCRHNFLANLTGLPALSAPVGRDTDGLPIGLQFVGDAWDEATLLAASAHLERIGAAKSERPRVSVSVLEPAG